MVFFLAALSSAAVVLSNAAFTPNMNGAKKDC